MNEHDFPRGAESADERARAAEAPSAADPENTAVDADTGAPGNTGDNPPRGGCARCAGEKTTVRGEEERRRLLSRLHRIEGQLRGIESMIVRDAYCNDILVQSAAAAAGLRSFNRDLLSRHLRTCVKRDLRAGDDALADEVINELLDALNKLMK